MVCQKGQQTTAKNRRNKNADYDAARADVSESISGDFPTLSETVCGVSERTTKKRKRKKERKTERRKKKHTHTHI